MNAEHPDLWALVRGELDNAAVFSAAGHLDRCEECRRELAETAAGHALLHRGAATVDERRATGGARAERRNLSEPELPPLPLPRRRTLASRPLLTLVATAAVVTGLAWAGTSFLGGDDDRAPMAGATPTVTVTASPPTPTAPVTEPSAGPLKRQSAVLQPVDSRGTGEVFMASGARSAQMRIETKNLPKLKRGQFFYVWLLDPATNKMLPLGQVGPGGTATFEVSLDLLTSYSAVDVSLEQDDGDPQHSPRSVLRAVYA